MGEYKYEKGALARVELSNDADNSVVADAVKFVFNGAKATVAPEGDGKADPKTAAAKSKVIFEETFEKGIDNWVLEKWDV